MTALRNLLDAVEAGTIPDETVSFSPLCGFDFETGYQMMQAYLGSLDAAKSLHKAMLPGWKWTICNADASVYKTYPDRAFSSSNSDPARAWLIAILMALVAMEGE